MIVFAKQGLKERINLCLFCLSLTDLTFMTTSFILYSDRIEREIENLPRRGGIFKTMLNYNVNTLYRSSWLSGFLTTLIACERCFCVLSPIKAKQVLKTSTMLGIILVVAAAIYAGGYVVNKKWSVACVFDVKTNTSVDTVWPSQFYLDNRKAIDILEGVVYGIVLPGTFIVVSIVTTILTVHGLHKMALWRDKSTSSSAMTASVAMTARDVALTRMLIGCSVLFVVCTIPTFMFRTAVPFVPDLSLTGRYYNMFDFMISVFELLNYFNSSFNFFIYYTMGTRYKETLHTLCGCCRHGKDPAIKSTTSAVFLDETRVPKMSESVCIVENQIEE